MNKTLIPIIIVIYSGFNHVHVCNCANDNRNIICKNNVVEYILPYGIGPTDGLVLHLNNLTNQNCTIILHSKEGLQILVFESKAHNQSVKNNINVISDNETHCNICSSNNCIDVKVLRTVASKIRLEIISTIHLKITATAARRKLNEEICTRIHELECKINASKICISSELQCDSNINCGTSHLNDEDTALCKLDIGTGKTIIIITTGLLSALILFTIFLYCLKKMTPTVARIFYIGRYVQNRALNDTIVSHVSTETLESKRTITIQPAVANVIVSLRDKQRQQRMHTKVRRLRTNSPVLPDDEVVPATTVNLHLNKTSPTKTTEEDFITQRNMLRNY